MKKITRVSRSFYTSVAASLAVTMALTACATPQASQSTQKTPDGTTQNITDPKSAASLAIHIPAMPVPADAYQILGNETTKTLPSGASVAYPAAWSIWQDTANLDSIYAKDPDGKMHIVMAESAIKGDMKDPEQAKAIVAQGFQTGLALLSRLGVATDTLKAVKEDHPGAQMGWDEIHQNVYVNPKNNDLTIVLLRRIGNHLHIGALQSDQGTLGTRQAQVNTIMLGLKDSRVVAETLKNKPIKTWDAETSKQYAAFLQDTLQKTGIPGAQVAVVQNGKIVFEQPLGVKELGKAEQINPDTRFFIASISKSMSSLLLGSLVDQKKLSWDEPLTDALKRAGAPFDTFAFADADFTKNLKVEHTFCACTGMPRLDLEMLFDTYTVDDTLNMMRTWKPTTKIGETYQYSNQMTALGGFVGARLAYLAGPNDKKYIKQPSLNDMYADAMQQRIFIPTGMSKTTARFDEAIHVDHAMPHGSRLQDPPFMWVPQNVETERFVEPVAPAGIVASTAHDMALYAIMEMQKGLAADGKTQVVSKENVLKREQPQIKISPTASYGLGWVVGENLGLPVVEHNGGMLGYSSRLVMFPEQGIGYVILANTADAGLFFRSAEKKLREILWSTEPKADKDLAEAIQKSQEEFAKQKDNTTLEIPATLQQRVFGTYKNKALGQLVVRQDPSDKTKLIFDFKELQSHVALVVKSEQATLVGKLMLSDPPMVGLAFAAEPAQDTQKATALVLDWQGVQYRFERE